MNSPSRRDFLGRAALLGTAAIGGGSLLAACGPTAPSTTSFTTRPRHGGKLNAAIPSGTSSDTLDPTRLVNTCDYARAAQLYDSLIGFDANAETRLQLAEEITPNADATSWTIRAREGVTFHNGKDFGADDILATFQRILNPSDPGSGAALLSAFSIDHARKLDKRTLRIPCTSPFSTLPDVLACYDYGVIPAGFDPSNPVGTGPFRYQSFTPGNESVFTRNASYWQHGLPYADEVTIVDYQDETSQVDSLLGGQANLAAGLSAVSIAPVKGGGGRITASMGGGWTPFVMRVDVAPFNDVNVRQAFRYICDRDQMISIVGNGQGTLGNDVFSIWDPEYDSGLPQRHQDLDHARFLLKKAGAEQLTVDLVSAPLVGGMTDAAQVFQEQAAAAGITVNVQQVTTTELFGPNFLSWPFAQDYWFYNPYFPQVAKATLPSGPYDETHWDDSRYGKLYAAGLATTDKARQTEIAHEMQLMDYESGGYVIPYFPPVIDGYAANVMGVVASKVGLSFNDFDFKHMWIAD